MRPPLLWSMTAPRRSRRRRSAPASRATCARGRRVAARGRRALGRLGLEDIDEDLIPDRQLRARLVAVARSAAAHQLAVARRRPRSCHRSRRGSRPGSMRTTVPSTTSPCLRLFTSFDGSSRSCAIVIGSRFGPRLGDGSGWAGSASAAQRLPRPRGRPRDAPQARARGGFRLSGASGSERPHGHARHGLGCASGSAAASASGRLRLRRRARASSTTRSAGSSACGVAAVISAGGSAACSPRPQRGSNPRIAAQADSFRRSSPCTLLGCDVPAATTPSACGGRLIHQVRWKLP